MTYVVTYIEDGVEITQRFAWKYWRTMHPVLKKFDVISLYKEGAL